MTIAAGFMCTDGIVLCADSQETISGYTKNDRVKVLPCLTGTVTFAFAGSGTSDYIDTAIEDVLRGDGGDDSAFPIDPDNLPDFRDELEKRLLMFFEKRISPWAAFPIDEKPTVELLIAVTHKNGQAGLFHYSGTALHHIHGAKAIGSGILLANSLIAEIYRPKHSIDEMRRIAAYIVSKVKQKVDTCGGYTTLTVLKNGGACGDVPNMHWCDNSYLALDREIDEERVKRIIAEPMAPIKWLKQPPPL